MSSRPREEKEGKQMVLSVENRTSPPGLEKREVDSFRNLTQLYIPSLLAKGDITVRHEKVD